MTVTSKPHSTANKAVDGQVDIKSLVNGSIQTEVAVKSGKSGGQAKRKKVDEDDILNSNADAGAMEGDAVEMAAAQDESILLAQAETGAATDAAATGSSSSAAGAEAGATAGAGGGAAGATGAAATAGLTTTSMIAIGAVAAGAAAAAGGGGSTAAPAAPAGDTTAPVIQSMTVLGTQVTLTYNEALDAVNIPTTGAFAVTVGGVANAVTLVVVNGSTVTLTLTASVPSGSAVQVVYTDLDGAATIQDAAGNDALGFTTGVAADGYIRGAQIYIDTNNNGVADAGELQAGVVTNADGNFILPAGSPTGVIIATGGVNIDTGVPNVMVLKAPSGSSMINPLTTLVQEIVESDTSSATAAEKVATATGQVVAALNLASGTDLTSYDPIAALAANPGDVDALAIQQAAVQVATLVTLAAESADTDASATTTVTTAINTVVANLATAITTAADASTTVDLTDATPGGDIETIIGSSVDSAVRDALVTEVDTATTAINVATTMAQITTAQATALDTTPPAAPTALTLTVASDTGTSGDNKTNDSTPNIRVSFNTTASNGTAAVAGNVVKVYEGEVQVGTSTLTSTNIANGYVDITIDTLTNADHTLTAKITDLVPTNVPAASAAYTITVDTTAPAAPALAEQGSTDTTNNLMNAAEAVTTTFRVTLPTTGSTAVAGDRVELLLGGVSFTTPEIATLTDANITNGYVDLTVVTADLGADGAKSLTAKITDIAGNASTASVAVTFTLDTIAAAPTLTLNSDTGSSGSDAITSSGVVNVSGLESGATWQYSTNGGTNWADGTGTSFTLSGDGAKSVIVRQTDEAGNSSASSSTFTFTLDSDAAAPTLALNSDSGSSNSDAITNSGTVNVSGLESGATWQYSTNGGTDWTSGTGSSFTLTGDGAKSVIVRQTDAAGNASANSSALAFTLDGTGPAFSSGAAANLAENTSISTAAYTSATSDDNSVSYAISGTDAALFDINADTGAVTFKAAPNYEAPADNGTNNVYNLTVTATDAAGNSTPQNVAITVTPVNEMPTLNSGATASLAENATGTVYTVTATDQDADTTLTYAIGGTDVAAFTIDPGTGVVTFDTPPDFETKNSYSVTVTASDGTNTTAPQAVTISVTDVNEAPTSSPIVNQTAVVGQLYTFNANTAGEFNDVDAGDSLTFSATGLPVGLSIDITTGVISGTATTEDLTNVVTVTATDESSQTSSRAFNLAVVTAPTITAITANVPQAESGANLIFTATISETVTVVGTPTLIFNVGGTSMTATYTGGDGTSSLTFSATAPGAGVEDASVTVSAINLSGGVSITGNTSGQAFVTDSIGQVVSSFVIDNNPPVFTSGSGGNFAENGTVAYTAATTDVTTVAYTLTGDDAAKFTLTNGVLTFIDPPNFESPTDTGNNNGYSVIITATDALGHITNQNVTITVTNDNEAPTVTSIATANFAENGTGTAYTTAASDPDANTTLTYTLTGTDAGLFNIVSGTGAVTFKTAPNYEAPGDNGTNNVYNITVTASDGTLSDSQDVAITVTDINEAPSISSGTAVNFAENGEGAAYTTVASDPDANTLTYTLTGTDADLFNIVSGTGVVTFKTAPNYEAPGDNGPNNVYNVTVTTSDGTLSDSQDVAITVTDVNEVPSISSGTAVNFAENGTGAAYTTSASDPDANTTLVYSLTGTDAGLFDISNAGVVTFKTAPNYEAPGDSGTNNVYNVTVTASDGALSDSQDVAITVMDVNEAPSISSGTSVNFAENGEGAAYTTVASDPDANTLTYTLTGTDADLFNIVSGTGVVTFKTAPNYEAPGDNGPNNVYNVTVTTSDGTLSDSQDVAITVTDVNEAPVNTGLTTSTEILVVNATLNDSIVDMFSDPDGDALSYTQTGLPSGMELSTSGNLTGAPTQTVTGHEVVFTATDTSGLSVSHTTTVDVVAAPAVSNIATLDGVSNLDVRSDLVLTFSDTIQLGSGQIRIMDDMGTSGWTLTNTTTSESKQDVTDNDVVITLADGVITGLTIGGVDKSAEMANSVTVINGNKLVISPAGDDDASSTDWDFDWDFGANYHIEIGAGVVTANGVGNVAISDSTTLNFTTVTPVGNATGAASQTMAADGTLATGYTWHHGHVSDSSQISYVATGDTGSFSGGTSMSFALGSHALVLQSQTGADNRNTSIGGGALLSGLGTDDIIYMDNLGDMSIPTTDGFKGAGYTVLDPDADSNGTVNLNTLTRFLNNADGGTQLQTVFADYADTGFAVINTALTLGGDLKLENLYGANLVVFG